VSAAIELEEISSNDSMAWKLHSVKQILKAWIRSQLVPSGDPVRITQLDSDIGQIHTFDVISPEFSVVLTGGPADTDVPIQALVFLN
jgi:hypothetical protein